MAIRRMRKKRKDDGEKDDSTLVRKKSRYLEGVSDISPYDYDLLRKFVSEHGKIIPSRITGATAKQQRQIRMAVRRARVLGVLP